jgi:2'-5' RNA ligase
MTLLYADKFVDKQPVEPVRWTARDFVLIQSFVGQGRHQVMARWPLR